MPYYAGIDIANKTSAICVLDESGEVVRRCEVPTSAAALRKAVTSPGPVRSVVESAPLAEWAAAELEAGGHEVTIIDARAARHLVRSKKKTDARDAHTLAQLARSGWYTAVHRKSSRARLLRSQAQARQGLVRTYKAMASQVRGLLRAHGVCVGRVSAGRFAERVRVLAGERVPALADWLEPLLQVYERSLAEARRLKGELEQAGRDDTVSRRLQSVPGVGPLVSQVYVATVDDPGRFRSGREVADYVGLAPRVWQSGGTCYRGSISKEGDKLLRWHLVEAAHVLLCHGQDCRLKRWGQRLARSKGAAKARVAVARKLAIVLWRLWRTGDSFEPWRDAAVA